MHSVEHVSIFTCWSVYPEIFFKYENIVCLVFSSTETWFALILIVSKHGLLCFFIILKHSYAVSTAQCKLTCIHTIWSGHCNRLWRLRASFGHQPQAHRTQKPPQLVPAIPKKAVARTGTRVLSSFVVLCKLCNVNIKAPVLKPFMHTNMEIQCAGFGAKAKAELYRTKLWWTKQFHNNT